MCAVINRWVSWSWCTMLGFFKKNNNNKLFLWRDILAFDGRSVKVLIKFWLVKNPGPHTHDSNLTSLNWISDICLLVLEVITHILNVNFKWLKLNFRYLWLDLWIELWIWETGIECESMVMYNSSKLNDGYL